MPIHIKICGITQQEDALLALETGANAMGLIFYSKSPRYVTPEQAKTIVRELPPFFTIVGVFVNPTIQEVRAAIETIPLNLLQLHGSETLEFCESLEFPYIKTFHHGLNFPKENIKVWEKSHSKAFLFDTADPKYGGSGSTFDWSTLKYKSSKPLVLSGGLTPENVAGAIVQVKPYAVDVCSGVEKAPGIKDKVKLRAFVEAVRNAECGMRSAE